jgi:hypothetical protein
MSAASIALRRSPLLTTSSALPRARQLVSHFIRPHPSFSQTAFKMAKDQSRGEETTGLSEWKQRPPYRIHEKNEDFDVKYEANCHCGKVRYQLSRREPLDSKLCHCTTCQTQHGKHCHTRLSSTCMTNTLQLHHFSGPPFSTRPTSTSPMATTISNGTTLLRNLSIISSLAKYAVRTAIPPSWTRAAT